MKGKKKSNVFVYIKGNQQRGNEIINYLLDIGGENIHDLDGRDNKAIYYINSYGCIDIDTISDENDCYKWIISHYTEVVLPKLQEHEFKPFEKVLCRNKLDEKWQCDFFISTDEWNITKCIVGGFYNYVIQYEGNQELLGTTNQPKEK